MDNYKNYFNEAYKQLLLEKDFDFTKDGIAGDEGFKKFLDDDSTEHIDGVVEDEIIDTDAWTEDELQKNYIGKVILECSVCHSRIYKDEDLVVLDEESGLANVEDECPVCNNSLGYTVIGKIEPFSEADAESENPEFPEEDEDEIEMPDTLPDDINDEEPEEDEEVEETEEDEDVEEDSEGEVEESLKDRLQRKHLQKESLDKDTKKSLNEDFYSEMRQDLLGEGKEDVCPNCGKNPCVCEGKEDVCPNCGKNPCVCEGCEKDESLTEEVVGDTVYCDEDNPTAAFEAAGLMDLYNELINSGLELTLEDTTSYEPYDKYWNAPVLEVYLGEDYYHDDEAFRQFVKICRKYGKVVDKEKSDLYVALVPKNSGATPANRPNSLKAAVAAASKQKDEALKEGLDSNIDDFYSEFDPSGDEMSGFVAYDWDELNRWTDWLDSRGVSYDVNEITDPDDGFYGEAVAYLNLNESLDEAKLDEKLPKSLSSGRAKDFIQNKYNNIDFENSTFDEISPDDLSRMSRDERNNVITKHNYGTMGEIGQRGARSGKLVQQDWNDKLKNSNVSADDPEEVRRHLGSDGKIYRVNPVEKDPEKLASRVGNGHIAKANQYRKNAKDAFKDNPSRYSWNDPEEQRARDLLAAQGYRNRAASAMDEPFANDPTIKDFRRTKNDVKLDKSWLNMSKDDEARYGDEVRSAELANEYGIRYARDVVDNEKRAKMYQDEAEKAKELGRKYMQTASDEEREEAKYNLDRATTRLNKTKERTAELETGIKDKLAGFKKRHSKEESLNEAPEGYNYENIYTPEEKEKKDLRKLLEELANS